MCIYIIDSFLQNPQKHNLGIIEIVQLCTFLSFNLLERNKLKKDSS